MSTLSLGNGPYQWVAGSHWSSVDSRAGYVCKAWAQSVDRVQSRQPWVILWDCLDSFHGKLDEGYSTRAEGSGDVTVFSRLCLDFTRLHRPEQTIHLKAVGVKELRKRKINKSCIRSSAQVLSSAICCGKIQWRLWVWREGLKSTLTRIHSFFVLIEKNVLIAHGS